jgi:hypothetical protein
MTRQGPHDPAAYEAFRSAPLPAAAAALAASGAAGALAALVQRHPAALGPHLLGLLSALPETLDPRTYSALLPRADTGAPSGLAIAGPPTALPPPAAPGRPPPPPTGSGGRRTDWAELPEAWRELAAVAGGAGGPGVGALASAASADLAIIEEAAALLHATEDLERAGLAAATAERAVAAGGPPPAGGGGLWPAPAAAAAWYPARVAEIDAAAGQLPHALALADLGLQRGAPLTARATPRGPTLGELQACGRVLAAALRAWFPARPGAAAPGGGQPGLWLVGLSEFALLPLAEQLEVALAGRSAGALEAEVTER